jgi:hypothetical protein
LSCLEADPSARESENADNYEDNSHHSLQELRHSQNQNAQDECHDAKYNVPVHLSPPHADRMTAGQRGLSR